MTIDVEDRSGVSVVRVEGDLTGKDGGSFVKAVAELLNRDDARVVLDLGQVSMVNSAGLGDLVRLTAQANTQGGRVLLANLTPFVTGVLEATRLDSFLEIADDVDGALAKLR